MIAQEIIAKMTAEGRFQQQEPLLGNTQQTAYTGAGPQAPQMAYADTAYTGAAGPHAPRLSHPGSREINSVDEGYAGPSNDVENGKGVAR